MSSVLADVLSIDQETLDVVAKNAAAEGYTFTKMPDTFGLDTTDFQPILNKMMDQYNKLKPDAIVLYVNPLAFPGSVQGSARPERDRAYPGRYGLRSPGHLCHGPRGGRRRACHGLRWQRQPAGAAGQLGRPNPCSSTSLSAIRRSTMRASGLLRCRWSRHGHRPRRRDEQAGAVDKAKVQQALINLTDLPTLERLMTFTPDATSMGITGQHGRVGQ